jgi:hypothetical protein
MAKTIDQLLREADDIIERRSQEKIASAVVASDEEPDSVEKLASALLSPVSAQPAAVQQESAVQTPFEKIAQAVLLVETLMNAEELAKLYQFEKAAEAKGFSEDQIADYMEKAAANINYKRLMPLIPILGAAGLAGAGGAYVGHKKGKQSGTKAGYSQAIQDVDKAMRDYQL